MTYKFVFDGRLPNLNDYIKAERTNRYRGAQIKADAHKAVYAQLKNQNKGLRITCPVYIRFCWIEANRRRDPDNVSSYGRKVILDALVDLGVLVDDSQKYIKGFTDEFYVYRDHPRIEFEITEVEDG